MGFTCPKCKQRVAVYRIFHNKPTPHPKQEYVSCRCGYIRWCGYSDITKFERWIERAADFSLEFWNASCLNPRYSSSFSNATDAASTISSRCFASCSNFLISKTVKALYEIMREGCHRRLLK